jgi:hypothetical protein
MFDLHTLKGVTGRGRFILVATIQFTPATKDGKPVSTFFQLEYNFSLY